MCIRIFISVVRELRGMMVKKKKEVLNWKFIYIFRDILYFTKGELINSEFQTGDKLIFKIVE